jgi:glycosyltransferase involved in cell wall biosynthesis
MPPRIFFIHTGSETFVKLDRDILSEFAEVHDFQQARKFPMDFINYWRGVKQSDIVFCWFASWNSFWALLLARLFHKPSVLVIGGYDIAKVPEANYGHQRRGLGKWVSRLAMRLATCLFTNSYHSQKEGQQNIGLSPEKVKVIYHGLPDPFGSLPQTPRERMALTVGKVDFPNLKRKGLQAFVEAAALLPDVQFVLVGDWADKAIDRLRALASANVLFTGRISDEELLDYYRKASVYIQASLHESFGMSVAEAMLAGCIPVVMRCGSLPEVVGECGVYISDQSLQAIGDGVSRALMERESIREDARQRVLDNFPLSRRKKQLIEIIEKSLSPSLD